MPESVTLSVEEWRWMKEQVQALRAEVEALRKKVKEQAHMIAA